MEDGRVVELRLHDMGLGGAVPAEVGRLSALIQLNRTSNQLTSVPAEIGQLTSLRELTLASNQLTSVPAEIGQLTSLNELCLCNNPLTILPAEIWRLPALSELNLGDNQLWPDGMSSPAAIRELRAAGCTVYLDDDVTLDE